MISIRTLSIPKRIVAIIVIISTAALLMAGIALIVHDIFSARVDLRTSAMTLATVVAENTVAAAQFRDRQGAGATLNSIRIDPSIVAACVYSDGHLFVSYVNSKADSCPQQPAGNLETWNYIMVSAPIKDKGKTIGVVELRATLAPTYAQLRMEIATIVVILLLAVLFSYALSARLQTLISEPILDLARTANEVSQRKDYSIRASSPTQDELGVLVNAFNEMLAQIQIRDAELRDRTADLSRANRMKDEFLATLSHELRTPLTAILAWAIMLRTGLPEDRRNGALEAIERNARVQSRLIDDLLDVSRIISGKFNMESTAVGLKEIIANAVDVVRPAAEARRIRVQFESSFDGAVVAGDAARLQQAVWNLLSNAVKFTNESGLVKVQLGKTNHHARIAVSDNGVGIAPEFLPYVFDRFRQADGSRARAYGGLGLGLAIVRHIVEMHGGFVSVQSEGQGRGATFVIELPLVASQVEETPSSRRAG